MENQNLNQKSKKERQTVYQLKQEEKLSVYERGYTVKRTFQGKISKEEMIHSIVRILLETDEK